MAPNVNDPILEESDHHGKEIKNSDGPTTSPWKFEIIWINVILFTYWHIAAIYGLYLGFVSVKWGTLFLGYLWFILANIGVNAGCHRLWSHRSYKAKLPLQIILMLFTCIAFQVSGFFWARVHRVHHKHCDTDADPHNATRGFFYSHLGWFFVRRHPDVFKYGQKIDISDLYANPVLMFQKKHFLPLVSVCCFILPTVVPMYYWGESFNNAYHITILRLVMNIHATCLINSAAHMWGNKPFDKNIMPTENIGVSIATLGEGFHNYHHTFPWDYRAAELGNSWNLTSKFIDFFAWVGWAYDLKTVSADMVINRASRTGDGSEIYSTGF